MSTIDTLLRQARRAYDSDHNAAERMFKLAIWHCPCNKQRRKDLQRVNVPLSDVSPIQGACTCRDYLTAAQARRPQMASTEDRSAWRLETPHLFPTSELALGSVYDLARTKCSCGSSEKPCDKQNHLAAFDGLVAIYTARKDPETLKVALMMITLAPGSAEGYLRVAKCIHKGALSFGAEQAPTARFIARCFYRHGLYNVAKYGNAADPKFKILRSCYQQMTKMDIVTSAPTEIQDMIFENLSFSDRMQAAQVCKAWRGSILSRSHVWREVEFGPQMKLSTESITRVLHQWAQGKATKITVEDGPICHLKPYTLNMLLKKAPDLEHLELLCRWDILNRAVQLQAVSSKALTRCRTMVLDGVAEANIQLLDALLARCCEVLESLTLVGLPIVDGPLSWTLPQLKYLKLVGLDEGDDLEPRPFPLARILCSTPALEHLYLDRCIVDEDPAELAQLESALGYRHGTALQALQTLVLGFDVQILASDELLLAGRRSFPPLPPNLRALDVLCEATGARHVLTCPDLGRPQPGLAKLEYFRCLAEVPQAEIYRLVEPSLGAENQLRHLEVCASPDQPGGDACDVWQLTRPECVETVGMHEFMWVNDLSYVSTHSGRRFLDWVDGFPAAHTVAAYPSPFEGAAEVILALVERGRFKTIYQDCLKGAAWDHALALAATKGVRVVHAPETPRPPVFPWPEPRL